MLALLLRILLLLSLVLDSAVAGPMWLPTDPVAATDCHSQSALDDPAPAVCCDGPDCRCDCAAAPAALNELLPLPAAPPSQSATTATLAGVILQHGTAPYRPPAQR